MAIPASALRIDDDISPTSPKGYSERDLQEMMATVPSVYDALRANVPHTDLMAARSSGDARVRALGTTYAHLFDMSSSAEVLAADMTDGQLRVAAGNHRIAAAQRLGVPFLPVQVRARTSGELDRLEAALEARYGPAYAELAATHRRADRRRDATASPRSAEREQRPTSRER